MHVTAILLTAKAEAERRIQSWFGNAQAAVSGPVRGFPTLRQVSGVLRLRMRRCGHCPRESWDARLFFLRRLRKEGLWPIETTSASYSEDDLFDVIELLYDTVSQGVQEEGYFHNFNGCGWHYRVFAAQPAKTDFRAEVNDLLQDYKHGFELTEGGEVVELPDPNLHQLLRAPLPTGSQRYTDEIEEASLILRRRHSTIAERRNAVRMLVDILESLRPKLKGVITNKDEDDLFNIANNFGIRHKNEKQRTNYDPLWLSWMFYYYLATIHFVTRWIEKAEEQGAVPTAPKKR